MREYKVDVGGTVYGMNELVEVKITQPLFEKFSAGNACTAEMSMSFYKAVDPPRMAKIVPYYRNNETDSWKQIGVFYIDERSEEDGLMTLQCYDSMLKADVKYMPEGDTGEWPKGMGDVAEEIAALMGVSLDRRCNINIAAPYVVEYPNEYTMREILQHIAAAHAGNWIMTAADKLLLVPLFGAMPQETHYLATEEGDYITLGGTRILV